MTLKVLEKLRKCAEHENTGFFVNLEQSFGSGRYKYGDPTFEPNGGILNAIADEVEAEIAEHYMLLPVDADGKPIHVGDVMCSAGIREKGHRVIVSAIFEDGFVEYGTENGLIGPLCQEDWVHANPCTLEDVIIDAMQFGFSSRAGDDVSDKAHEFADKIRELYRLDRQQGYRPDI